MPERAMILAAGLGLRMRPLTERIPKPLVQVAGRPLIDYALDFVEAGGAREAVVNTSYLADLLEAHLRARTAPHITVSREDAPLETGGGIAKALPLLGAQPFFSLNSDAITLSGPAHPFIRLQEAWNGARMDALLLLQPRESASGYEGAGDFFIGENGALTRRGDAPSAPYVFTGVQLMHPRLFTGCPKGAFSLNVLYNRDLSRIHAIVHDGLWLHVGDTAGLAQAEAALAQRALSA
jgi:MurNAc alpha-1-phosphate uridylyltransferase